MTEVDNNLVEIWQNVDDGYQALVYYEGWRVAILNDHEKFRRLNTTYLERHDLTDEVFVLLSGTCSLYVGDGGDDYPGHITLLPMESHKIYNVKKGVWHNLELTPGSSVLIVENSNTAKSNSSYLPVTPKLLPVSE